MSCSKSNLSLCWVSLWRLCMISLDTYFYKPLFKVPTLKLKTVNLVYSL